jgi:3-deoxy-D-manno-octulosonic-acid transferase
VALYLLYRGIRDRRYFTHLAERWGFLPGSLQTTGAGAIWFHAVSVGEVLSAVELIRAIRAQRPRLPIYVSTSTLSGRATAEQRLAGVTQGIFFAPLDYRSSVRRVLRRLRPAAVVILETEIWPNLYREAKRAGASLLVVNGRISDRALPRYRAARAFFRYALAWPDAIFTQSAEDTRRFVLAGAPIGRVHTAGNLKYDFTPPASGVAPEIAQCLDRVRPEPVWIAASTMPARDGQDVDEADAVIAAFRELAPRYPKLLLVLVPRRPERFDIAAEKLARAGVQFVRRSALPFCAEPQLPAVLLLDSIGELSALFEHATVVFMGGTLASRGGHNILEPAYFAKPVIAGPHMENFAGIAAEFTAAGALVRIAGARELSAAVETLARDPARAAAIGAKARELALAKRGTVEHMAAEILNASAEGVPNPLRTLAVRLLFKPLSWLWLVGRRYHMAWALASRRSLHTPVVSVGGLTMGGAGKSPLVSHLAERFLEAGRDPAILSRGYRRKSGQEMVVVPRGNKAAVELTGDEAQVFVREALAHVGIGANRWQVGERMERELHPDVFLLDDGFQHVRLARNHDLVLIDALDPLGGGIFPLGRRREPMEGLARATEVIITRVEPRQRTTGIERLIRRYNPSAPVFRSRVVPQEWVDLRDGTRVPLDAAEFRRVAAFCGLGSPRSFWRTLESIGIEVAFRWAFGDHHPYRPAQLRRLAGQATAMGAEALVTTEKDVMNLCEGASELLAPHRVYWLRIGIEIEKEEELLRRIL